MTKEEKRDWRIKGEEWGVPKKRGGEFPTKTNGERGAINLGGRRLKGGRQSSGTTRTK